MAELARRRVAVIVMNSRRFIMWSTGLSTQSACRTLNLPQTGPKILSL
jgi:hypothetical protein